MFANEMNEANEPICPICTKPCTSDDAAQKRTCGVLAGTSVAIVHKVCFETHNANVALRDELGF